MADTLWVIVYQIRPGPTWAHSSGSCAATGMGVLCSWNGTRQVACLRMDKFAFVTTPLATALMAGVYGTLDGVSSTRSVIRLQAS